MTDHSAAMPCHAAVRKPGSSPCKADMEPPYCKKSNSPDQTLPPSRSVKAGSGSPRSPFERALVSARGGSPGFCPRRVPCTRCRPPHRLPRWHNPGTPPHRPVLLTARRGRRKGIAHQSSDYNPTRQRGESRRPALPFGGCPPRWRVLMLRYFGICPEGARTRKPRATPWESGSEYAQSPVRATQSERLVSPFQGSIAGGWRGPRALPWADLWLPHRGDGQICATSKLARRVSMARVPAKRELL
jgi:hypothetical protein